MEFDPRAEFVRLEQSRTREANWKRWGPYLPERQWGTVREDYSADGNPWAHFPHDHARSRTYRWGEDGLLGWTDRECRFCFSVALWNGKDPILKERLFGLTGPEGNHGEDVNERYWYLDSTPCHTYSRAVYRYPQREFPYAALVAQNQARSRHETEYELEDAGLFDSDRFFDVQVEYAKASPDDVLVRIRAINRGPSPATLHLLPTFWFRNTWVWGCKYDDCVLRPDMRQAKDRTVTFAHETLGEFVVANDDPRKEWKWLFTDNETNERRLYGKPDGPPFVKDAFHRWLIDGEEGAVNPRRYGTKTAA
ncbi:MAG TPA: hypothetical protein VGN57_14960 [Pirellulaceae bacterium]|jgi:hypothetical protein|nr:hypothetical protein [Pirellulaceae bacterium]